MARWSGVLNLVLPLAAALSREEQHTTQCESWAAQGECLRNSHFMLGACRPQCTRSLVDTKPDCINWARDGECDHNPVFMAGACNASCVARASDAQVQERERLREAARMEREARRAAAADDSPRRARQARSADDDVEGALAGNDGAPSVELARAADGVQRDASAALEAAEAAAERAEEDFAEAKDAARAVAEALAGQPVHEPVRPGHGDAPGLSPAASGGEARETLNAGAEADASVAEVRARAAQHLQELRTQSSRPRGGARGARSGGAGGGGGGDENDLDAATALDPARLERERAARDAERLARRERARADALRKLGLRTWLLFRTLPVTFTLLLVAISARRERASGKASSKLAFAPPGFAVGTGLPAWARALADLAHRLRLAYVRAGGPGVDSVARALVGMYYVNEAVAYVEELEDVPLWEALQTVNDVLDMAQLLLPAIVACLVLGYRTTLCSALVGLDVLKDVLAVGARIVLVWMHAHFLYINELMIKKLSMLGCTLLMLASVPENRSKSKSRAMSGALMADALNAASAISGPKSALLLAARLLVACLFMYVGVQEVSRIVAGRTPYMQGDAHDTLWPKIIELFLVLPFILGYRTRAVCQVLAVTLLLESALVWTFWRSDLDLLRVHNVAQELRVLSHMREHFCTNAAVAGGLLLLQEHGGGKYTLDEYMKKQD